MESEEDAEGYELRPQTKKRLPIGTQVVEDTLPATGVTLIENVGGNSRAESTQKGGTIETEDARFIPNVNFSASQYILHTHGAIEELNWTRGMGEGLKIKLKDTKTKLIEAQTHSKEAQNHLKGVEKSCDQYKDQAKERQSEASRTQNRVITLEKEVSDMREEVTKSALK
ncbi:hypothetical protein NE237_019993 [Protea cynaroides]|uniref:Uncharacterized protein n=1 Tax=Protea cynaroides TaxID=273540 RepID=A0A9Q0H884_9MAGN|nr:hypothetical protein NE237_019993 [Protea cynaroides]